MRSDLGGFLHDSNIHGSSGRRPSPNDRPMTSLSKKQKIYSATWLLYWKIIFFIWYLLLQVLASGNLPLFCSFFTSVNSSLKMILQAHPLFNFRSSLWQLLWKTFRQIQQILKSIIDENRNKQLIHSFYTYSITNEEKNKEKKRKGFSVFDL